MVIFIRNHRTNSIGCRIVGMYVVNTVTIIKSYPKSRTGTGDNNSFMQHSNRNEAKHLLLKCGGGLLGIWIMKILRGYSFNIDWIFIHSHNVLLVSMFFMLNPKQQTYYLKNNKTYCAKICLRKIQSPRVRLEDRNSRAGSSQLSPGYKPIGIHVLLHVFIQ